MLLSVVTLLPLLFALVLIAWPSAKTLRPLALGFSIIHPVLLGLTLATTLYSGLVYFWKNRAMVLQEM